MVLEVKAPIDGQIWFPYISGKITVLRVLELYIYSIEKSDEKIKLKLSEKKKCSEEAVLIKKI